jgi:hypothetical protein
MEILCIYFEILILFEFLCSHPLLLLIYFKEYVEICKILNAEFGDRNNSVKHILFFHVDFSYKRVTVEALKEGFHTRSP